MKCPHRVLDSRHAQGCVASTAGAVRDSSRTLLAESDLAVAAPKGTLVVT
jgi:hypothetical protein